MNGGKGGDDALFGLFAMSAKVLARSGDPAAFLDWIARHGPGFAPEMARGIDPRTGPPRLAFRAMGFAIYNAMPLPEADFEVRRIAEPGDALARTESRWRTAFPQVKLGRRAEALGALWERDGALDWLRAAWNEVRKGLRPYTGEPWTSRSRSRR